MLDVSPDIARNITRFATALVPMLLGMILHEVAHGYAACKLGDPTAKLAGRLTMNPLSHLDVTGTLFFVLTSLASPFVLGWAKPVPVQPRYFRNPRRGMMLVSFAGPFANFLLALLFGAIYALFIHEALASPAAPSPTLQFLLRTAFMGVWINLILGWFNLLPLPSLDGGHILAGFLPPDLARRFYACGKYGLIILVVLLASGILRSVMEPLLIQSLRAVSHLFSIPSLLFIR
jgi:Zn-dependent protease